MTDGELTRLSNNLTKVDTLEKVSNSSTGAHLGLSISHLISKSLGKKKFNGLSIKSEKNKGS